MQSEVAYEISYNILSTAVEDARTWPQPGEMGIETSIVPWEAPESSRERPEWLLEGWAMKVTTRKNGKTARVKNRFYYDLVLHHRFRSRKEVECFIKTGMIRGKTSRTADGLMTVKRRYKGGPDVRKGTKEVLMYEKGQDWFCRWCREGPKITRRDTHRESPLAHPRLVRRVLSMNVSSVNRSAKTSPTS